MSIKPILFNTEMVRAILDGRKTVTRRVVKLPDRFLQAKVTPIDLEDNFGHRDFAIQLPNGGCIKAPYRPGDILYVRETWCAYHPLDIIDGAKYAYKANTTAESERCRRELGYKWRPSIHMPREAARIWLRVTNVRVERLQEIDANGCVKEGITECPYDSTGAYERGDFQKLWDSTIKPADREHYGWAANPFCWVISFERISKDEAMQ